AAYPGKAVVLACASGRRTEACLARLPREATAEAYVLEGGLAAWKRAGMPVVQGTAPPISLARQTMIGAGLMVLLWLALGVFVSPWFLLVVGFVGVMLTVGGGTGFCPMTRILARLPWNRAARA
ncbi:MAG: rhodanese family protein, partial [Elioraea sp.]|nr:rhodanese family protein [Elioraea sp.]